MIIRRSVFAYCGPLTISTVVTIVYYQVFFFTSFANSNCSFHQLHLVQEKFQSTPQVLDLSS